MSKDELNALLGGWEGYTLGTVGRVELGSEGQKREEIHLELLPLCDHPRVCTGCGRSCRSIHDSVERWVDDLPILGAETRLLVHRVRVACPACGPKLEKLSWLEPYARVTVRLAESEFAIQKGHRYATVVITRRPNACCGSGGAAAGKTPTSS